MSSTLWAVLSPLTIFSVCVGMGATGLLLKHLRLPPTWVGLAALLGGLLFYGLSSGPLGLHPPVRLDAEMDLEGRRRAGSGSAVFV